MPKYISNLQKDLKIGISSFSEGKTSLKVIAGNVGLGTTLSTNRLDIVGGVKISGVITATSFSGDGSGLTGVPGFGSDATGNSDGFFYTNAIKYITQNTTVSSPDPTIAPTIFTSYEDIIVSDGIDFTIGDGNELLTSVLNLNQLTLP